MSHNDSAMGRHLKHYLNTLELALCSVCAQGRDVEDWVLLMSTA